jgi:hypothetical protein
VSRADESRGSSTDERAALRRDARAMMEAHWVDAGYTAPNATVYPWQWLWDSCFHALVWCELGDADRAVRELENALAMQDAHGFVPHMDYHGLPDVHADFWGRRRTSSITQPPMYGHAVAELVRRGVDVPDVLVERAGRGLAFLLRHRARHLGTGLVVLCHPWESGADDSPRWDDACPDGFDTARWRVRKGELMATILRSPHGAPVANGAFVVASAGFNALVAFNARELVTVTGDARLAREADELAERLAARWDEELGTWVDGGAFASGSGRVRTIDALLPTLVVPDGPEVDRAFAAMLDPDAYGGPCGPDGVHHDESVYAPGSYWRGPAWPQLSYLVWRAAERRGMTTTAAALGEALVAGARRSGLAEYWDAATGAGSGAVPQSWAALAVLVADVPRPGPRPGDAAPGPAGSGAAR